MGKEMKIEREMERLIEQWMGVEKKLRFATSKMERDRLKVIKERIITKIVGEEFQKERVEAATGVFLERIWKWLNVIFKEREKEEKEGRVIRTSIEKLKRDVESGSTESILDEQSLIREINESKSTHEAMEKVLMALIRAAVKARKED